MAKDYTLDEQANKQVQLRCDTQVSSVNPYTTHVAFNVRIDRNCNGDCMFTASTSMTDK